MIVVFVLFSEYYTTYEGTYKEVKGVALSEAVAKRWITEQPYRPRTSYDYEEFETIE